MAIPSCMHRPVFHRQGSHEARLNYINDCVLSCHHSGRSIARMREEPILYFADRPFLETVDPRVMRVWEMEQYKQRTPGWYEARKGRITASSVGDILMMSDKSCGSYMDYYKDVLCKSFKIDAKKACNSKRSQLDFIFDKCGLGKPFTGNEFTRWGQKFENIVTNIYSQMHQVDVLEFGLLPHPTIDFLAASPDGISTDGIMLEIKCPPCRQVANHPSIYYWQQMQIQMMCTGLEYCDFFDAHFVEYIHAGDWEVEASRWREEHPDVRHHIYGIMLSYEPNDACQDYEDDVGGVDNDDTSGINNDEHKSEERSSSEKTWKHIYPPPNIIIIEDFKNWANEIEIKCREKGLQSVVRTHYKLHEYYISRATVDRQWFESNLDEMHAVWKQVLIGRTEDGLNNLRILQERMRNDQEDKRQTTKKKKEDKLLIDNPELAVFVDIDVSRAVESNAPVRGKKSCYIHRDCLL